MQTNQAVKYEGYSFSALPDTAFNGLRAMGTSKLRNYYEPDMAVRSDEEFGISTAHFRGALLRLFGPPPATLDSAEEAFEYILKAEDEYGDAYLLTVYQGSTGPAIGGQRRQRLDSRDAAEALIRLIESTPPADFEATVYYGYEPDRTLITYGCRHGKCYYQEIPARDTSQS